VLEIKSSHSYLNPFSLLTDPYQLPNGTSLHYLTPIGIGAEHFLALLCYFIMFCGIFSMNKCHKLEP